MGFLSSIFSKLLSSDVSNTKKFSKTPTKYYSDEYHAFYDKYSDKAYDLYDKFECNVEDLQENFCETYDYKKRLSIINSAINKYEKMYSFFSEKGAGGIEFFNDEYKREPFSAPESYVAEYEPDFCSIDCLQWLKNLYETDIDHVKDVIHQEYIIAEYGSEEEYQEELHYQQEMARVKKSIIKYIKQNGMSAKQVDILAAFPDDSEYTKYALSQLEGAGKLIRSKENNRIVFTIPQ